jgi:hypothetical protein
MKMSQEKLKSLNLVKGLQNRLSWRKVTFSSLRIRTVCKKITIANHSICYLKTERHGFPDRSMSVACCKKVKLFIVCSSMLSANGIISI